MTTLTQLFTGIANAIRSKTGGTAQIAAENFPAEIVAIATGTDTSDANATAADIEAGKTAYVNGQKVTGNLPILGDTAVEETPQVSQGKVSMGGEFANKIIVAQNSKIEFLAPYSSFGTATAADVAAGKTFTGADGLLVEGTAASGLLPVKEAAQTITVQTTDISKKIDFYMTMKVVGYVYFEVICESLSICDRYVALLNKWGSAVYDFFEAADNQKKGITLKLNSNNLWIENQSGATRTIVVKAKQYDALV